MTLASLIKKGGLAQIATATVATDATHAFKPYSSVASVATVAVAKSVRQHENLLAERAAIVEANGVPQEWAEGFAQLDQGQPPENVPEDRWRLFIDDCGRFLDGGWAKQAAALGWGPLNLFGCDRYSPLVRLDHAGLIWLVEGRKLVELSRVNAVIQCADGNRLTFSRRPTVVGQVVVAWEMDGQRRSKTTE